MINNILGLLALAKKTVLLDNIRSCLLYTSDAADE